MGEVWKDVIGYEGRYQVSNFGNIKSLPNLRRKTEIILKQSKHKRSEHRVVNLTSNDGRWKQKVHWVHRLVLEAFVGPCPEGMEGCHKDGDPTNNHAENLRWDTRESNIEDVRKHGTLRGENNGRAKLCLADVRIIKQRIEDGEGNEEIAKDFLVSPYTIKSIRNEHNWSHV